MTLYDSFIQQISRMTVSSQPVIYQYKREYAWPESRDFELLMQRDSAFELGEGNRPAVNITCVSTDPVYAGRDEVVVIGPELKDLNGPSSYARITILRTGDIESDDEFDTETAYRAILDMDFVKYHVFPKGFMVRTSGQSNREQVRISKKALAHGISFERIGDTYIRHYKENPNVLNVKIIFITASDADYKGLGDLAGRVKAVTNSLSKILEGMPTECGACGLKDICDEVEGLKELHFGKEGIEKKK